MSDLFTALKIEHLSIISIPELNQVLSAAKGYNLVSIDFKNHIERIDIAFIAGLLLYSRQTKTRFHISYKQNSIERIFEVRQYLKQYEELYGEHWNTAIAYFQDISTLGDKDLVGSRSFAPIIFIDRDTIDSFFRSAAGQATGTIATFWNNYLVNILSGTNNQEKAYMERENSVFRLLKDYPPIYTFVFSIIYSKVAPFRKSSKSGNSNEKVQELWEFTTDYVKGLHELAKNIVEHSEYGHGMITIRAYDGQESTESLKFLEAHLFDLGTTGIIPKLYKDTLKKKSIKIFEEDLKILEGPFTIRDLIKSTVSKKLNQQIYRDLAHYGLVKFYRLVERNQGVVICGSYDRSGKRDLYYSEEQLKTKALDYGTSYFFQLPFRKELFRTSPDIAMPPDMQGTVHAVSGVGEILNFNLMDSENLNVVNRENGEVLVVDFNLSGKVGERDEEAALFRKFIVLKDEYRFKYCSIDMSGLEMSSSTLLRFLSHLSTRYSQHFIVYNLDYELYSGFIEDNAIFYQLVKDMETSTPYWFDKKAMLIYSKLRDTEFYFADLLFGRTSEEFMSANYIVSHTFPNTTSITREGKEKASSSAMAPTLTPFFYKSSLLPFDLLLQNQEGKTIFQTNLSFSLNQNLPDQ